MKESLLDVQPSVAGAKLVLQNPDTGEAVILNVAPSMVGNIERVFYED